MKKISLKAKGILLCIFIVVAIAGVLAGYLLVKEKKTPKLEQKPKLYRLDELLPKYRIGESYLYSTLTQTEVSGREMESRGEMRVDPLEVKENGTLIQYTQNFTIPSKHNEVKVVYTQFVSESGELLSTELKEVKPGGYRLTVEQQQEQQKFIQEFVPPTRPIAIGESWGTPLEYELKQPVGSVKFIGSRRDCLVDREKLITPAGEFDCLRISSEITLSGEGLVNYLKVEAELIGNQTYWIDLGSGIPIKLSSHSEMETRSGHSQPIKVFQDFQLELLENKT